MHIVLSDRAQPLSYFTACTMDPWKEGTPDIPASAAVITVHASTRINAPASLVFRTLRNTDTWRDWNRFVPKVNITHQPPEIDEVTAQEVAELVKNTSILGSIDSQITDGAAPGSGGSLTGRRMSMQEEDGYRLSPPPVTRDQLRRASAASGMSGMSGGRISGLGDRPKTSTDTPRRATEATLQVPNGGGGNERKKSAAQMFEASRRASAAAPATTTSRSNDNVMIESPDDPNVLVPAPPTAAAKEAEAEQNAPQGRRASAVNVTPNIAKRMMSINAIYGEPSVRIQVGTKMTFHCRMKMPTSMMMNQETAIIVNEVSRLEDDNDGPIHLNRVETHTQSRTGVYRIVWSMQSSYSPPKSFPKFLLQAQRVHEIRPVKRGDGKEECVYEDWECQRGVLAGKVKKRYGDYLQARFEEWGRRLGDYAEAMGGAVERRDFSVA